MSEMEVLLFFVRERSIILRFFIQVPKSRPSSKSALLLDFFWPYISTKSAVIVH